MDWSLLMVLALVGAFLLWRHSNKEEGAKVASARLESDRLYQHIKTGMREYDWHRRGQKFKIPKDGELLFETPHLSAFHVSHFAESRVGFYFKDIEEFGLYSFFAGNGDETYESYYRSDRTFQKEQRLVTLDE